MTDSQPTSTPAPPSGAEPAQPTDADQDFKKLADQVAERVWKLWRDDLRRSNERRGADGARLRLKDRR
jgi:hypothetical protein